MSPSSSSSEDNSDLHSPATSTRAKPEKHGAMKQSGKDQDPVLSRKYLFLAIIVLVLSIWIPWLMSGKDTLSVNVHIGHELPHAAPPVQNQITITAKGFMDYFTPSEDYYLKVRLSDANIIQCYQAPGTVRKRIQIIATRDKRIGLKNCLHELETRNHVISQNICGGMRWSSSQIVPLVLGPHSVGRARSGSYKARECWNKCHKCVIDGIEQGADGVICRALDLLSGCVVEVTG